MELLKNAGLAVTTTLQTLYTCPAATTAIVIMAQCANVDGANNADISLQWLDSSAGNAAFALVHTVVVPAKSGIGLLDGKLVLEAGDALQARASADGDLVLTISVLERS